MNLKIAGEPFDGGDVFLAAGEDLVNNRLLVTLIDWAIAVNNGWKTKLDLSDEELTNVRDAITLYLKQKKS